MNYFLTHIIQKKINLNELNPDLIETYYSLTEAYNFVISELDNKFIDYLISHKRQLVLNLDENLIELHQNFADHKYNEHLRY